MKKKLVAALICTMLIFSAFPMGALAYTDIYSNVYDENEYQQLKAFLNFNSASDFGYSNGRSMSYMYDENDPAHWYGVTWAPFTEGSDTVYHVTSIDWMTSGSFYSLNGDLDLSNFDHLQSFQTSYNHIDSLKVAHDTELTTLVCAETHLEDTFGTVDNVGLTSLDVSTNPNLITLNCSRNSISSLDVGENTLLQSLDCSRNSINTLDLSKNTALGYIDCSNNKITSLDTSAAGTSLEYLFCNNNELSSLNVSGNTAVKELSCNDNHLTGGLNLTHWGALQKLNCANNQLTSLTIGSSTGLLELNCSNNAIGTLDVSHSTGLTSLDCGSNGLGALDVGSNNELTHLDCSKNNITALDTHSNTKLTSLNCSGNKLTGLDVSKNTVLTELLCGNNSLGSLDVTLNTALTNLDCTGDGLTSLDVSKNVSLTSLLCGGNSLKTLDTGKNPALLSLDCSGNVLESLDVSKNTALEGLDCSKNKLSALDLTGTPTLNILNCRGNLLETLDLSGLPLISLDSTDNPLTYVRAGVPYDWGEYSDVRLTSAGNGYVGLYFDWFNDKLYAQATPKTGAAFYNWTNGSAAAVSTASQYGLAYETEYNLTANFLSLTSTSPDGKISVGEKIVLTPNIEGGTWDWDSAFFSATFNSPATFTARKAGTSTITYTVDGVSVSYTVTIPDSGTAATIPATGQEFNFSLLMAVALLGALGASAGVIAKKRKGDRA